MLVIFTWLGKAQDKFGPDFTFNKIRSLYGKIKSH